MSFLLFLLFSLTLFRYYLLFSTIFFLGGGSQSFTFNRFATIFCYFQQFVVDFPLLTDFSLFFHIFHYISRFSIFNRYPAIFFWFSTIFCWFSTIFCWFSTIFCWFSNIYLPILRIVCSYIYKGKHFLSRIIKT